MQRFLFLALCLGSGGGWVFDSADLPDYLFDVSDLVVTPDGETFFLDSNESRIYHLDKNGVLLGHFGRRGEGPGEVGKAIRLQYVPANRGLYVFDRGRARIAHFKRDGSFVKDWSVPPLVAGWGSVLIDDKRIVYSQGYPSSQEKKGATIRILDLDSGEEKVLQRLDYRQHGDGSRVSRPGNQNYTFLPWTPAAWVAVGTGKRLYLGSTASLDLSIYDISSGELTGSLRDPALKPRPLTAEEIKAFEQDIHSRIISEESDFRASLLRFFIDSAGRLWAQLNPPPGALEQRYRVYDEAGKLLGKLTLAARPRVVLYGADERFLRLVVYLEEGDEQRILIKKQAYRLD